MIGDVEIITILICNYHRMIGFPVTTGIRFLKLNYIT